MINPTEKVSSVEWLTIEVGGFLWDQLARFPRDGGYSRGLRGGGGRELRISGLTAGSEDPLAPSRLHLLRLSHLLFSKAEEL